MASSDVEDAEAGELELASSEKQHGMSTTKSEIEKLIQDDSTGQLKAARTTLLEILTISDDVMHLLLHLSPDQLEDQTLNDIAEQLLKVLKDICEYLMKLQPEILSFVGEVMCLDSAESITLMYKFHDVYFLSKQSSWCIKLKPLHV